MKTVFGHQNLDPKSRTVGTIGTFDGVHLGHEAIITATVAAARAAGLPSLLLTFDVHPRQVLRPGEPVDALTDLDDKLELISKFDLDYACVLQFEAIRALSATDFYEQILQKRARLSHLFVGANFRFGAGAAGDPNWLRQAGRGVMEVTEFPLKKTDDITISSTVIRQLLRDGRVDEIKPLLGRNITLRGQVVKGHGRGASLGFPTANLKFDQSICRPANGVYAGYLWVNGSRWAAVVNCGNKPTFGGEPFSCEAHVLNHDLDLYGQNAKIELAKRLRDEMKFPSPNALSKQIAEDISRARTWFTLTAASRSK